jgi:hypothetical protein
MQIDSKKILGDTPAEWHERTGTNPRDFIAEGVHYNNIEGVTHLLDEFAKRVPYNTEVVVNYRVSTGYYESIAWGTALIPKSSAALIPNVRE